jgi:hypothetical protein
VKPFDVPRVADANGYVLRLPRIEAGGASALVHVVALRRGRFVFLLRSGPDSIDDAGLVRLLAERQAMKAPPGLTAEGCGGDHCGFGGRLVDAIAGATGAYLAGVWFVAWLRDPLRNSVAVSAERRLPLSTERLST